MGSVRPAATGSSWLSHCPPALQKTVLTAGRMFRAAWPFALASQARACYNSGQPLARVLAAILLRWAEGRAV